jgi:phenylalanyl-tRNA synthetase beta chain
MLALTSGRGYRAVKGAIEAIVEAANPAAKLEVVETRQALLDAERSAELRLNGELFGYLGEVSAAGLKQFELRGPATVAELRLSVLLDIARPVAKQRPLSPYPAVTRDLNVVFDESVRWAEVEMIVRAEGGELLESLAYQDTYRDEKRLGAGRKSLLFSFALRSQEGTLTNEQADALRAQIVARLAQSLGGELRA